MATEAPGLALKRSDYLFLVLPAPDVKHLWADCTRRWRSYGLGGEVFTENPLDVGGNRSLFKYPAVVSGTESGLDLPHGQTISDSLVADRYRMRTYVQVDTGVKVLCLHMATMTLSGFQMVPRSSITKSRFQLRNSPAIIDPTYRGTIKIRYDVLDSSSLRSFSIKENETYVQLVAPDMGAYNVLVVDPSLNFRPERGRVIPTDLFLEDTTSRGSGGFGSTGAGGTTVLAERGAEAKEGEQNVLRLVKKGGVVASGEGAPPGPE
jgi:dUTPase